MAEDRNTVSGTQDQDFSATKRDNTLGTRVGGAVRNSGGITSASGERREWNNTRTGSGTGRYNKSNNTGSRPSGPYNKRRFVFKKKECYFTKNNISYVDYKDVNLLKMFVGYSGQILISKFTGLNPKFQRRAAIAVKRARFMALLPFVGEVKKNHIRRGDDRNADGRPKFAYDGGNFHEKTAPVVENTENSSKQSDVSQNPPSLQTPPSSQSEVTSGE